jgi:hypothetical protein
VRLPCLESHDFRHRLEHAKVKIQEFTVRYEFLASVIAFLAWLFLLDLLIGVIFLVSIVTVWIAYSDLLVAAKLYGQELRSLYDMYRFNLYKASYWELPPSPDSEHEHGRECTRYLFRHLTDHHTSFIDDEYRNIERIGRRIVLPPNEQECDDEGQ